MSDIGVLLDRRDVGRAQARLEGIRDALAERSIAIQPRHFAQGYWGIHEGRQLLRRLLESKPWPTAVTCGNAYLTIGALLEAQAMGIAVPAEMSIVGYDDIEIMAELPIPITTPAHGTAYDIAGQGKASV